MKDFYRILGIPREASAEQIHTAYRAAAKQHHPDRNNAGSGDGRFRAVQEAYETLGNPARKADYDASFPGKGDGSGSTTGGRVHVRVSSADPFTGPHGKRPPVWPVEEEGPSFRDDATGPIDERVRSYYTVWVIR